MNKKTFCCALSGCLLVAAVGCSTNNGVHGQYIIPHIDGRVVDAETGMPIERVVVLRNPRSSSPYDADFLRAGGIQEKQHSIYTDSDGVFEVPSQKDLELGGDKTWTSVTLKFTHPDYHMFSTNFVHTAGGDDVGEPKLETGEIELHRLPTHVEERK